MMVEEENPLTLQYNENKARMAVTWKMYVVAAVSKVLTPPIPPKTYPFRALVLLSRDGDCWQVGSPCDEKKGNRVTLRLRNGIPDFSQFGFGFATQFPVPPQRIIDAAFRVPDPETQDITAFDVPDPETQTGFLYPEWTRSCH